MTLARKLHHRAGAWVALLLPIVVALLLLGCQAETPEAAETTAAPTASPAGAPTSASFDHTPFDRILQAHVKDGLVDYASLKAEHAADLDEYLQSLADAKGFDGSDDELAFWLNAYNASVIKGILDRYPNVKSVMDIEGFFDDKRWRAAGRLRSLNGIENEIIRPRFEDPRIHFILVCAAESCPPLPNRAMDGKTLQSQLDRAAKEAIDSIKYVQVDPDAKVLRLTRIMSWYRKDFEADAGSLQAYVLKYIEDPGKSQLQGADYTVQFMDYDWALNDAGATR
ncbi:MAG: DUF547 domain-containing protein [Armatimonadetes bacterium]|nr:DUF547 domain-containing protein [Armatimonadota bacterium]